MKPKIIVQVSGGMISLVSMPKGLNLDIELRDYDIDTTTDTEFWKNEQEVYRDENNNRYIIV